MSQTHTRSIPARRDKSIEQRVSGAVWDRTRSDLDGQGFAVIDGLLGREECGELASLYVDASLFRKHVIMARHGYGRGEYKYFDYPLPDLIGRLRTMTYPHLAQLANRWNADMGIDIRYPAEHSDFLKRCHEAGQGGPTPLLLQYGPGDFNCLHQDLYGEHVFPLQMAILLSEPGEDFSGGEFVLTEQRPRMQARVTVVPLTQGDAVIFPVRHRPAKGTRGFYRLNVKHGVSEVRTGRRSTLGIIFHDAK